MDNTGISTGLGTDVVDSGTMTNPLLQDGNLNTDNVGGVEPTIKNVDDTINGMFNNMPLGNEIDDMLGLIGTEKHMFGGVDLSGYGEDLNFEDQEVREIVLNNINDLKAQGLNNQQMQFMIGKQLEMYREGMASAEEEKPMTPAEIKQTLEQELSVEEKRNVPALLKWANTAISPDLLTPEMKQALFTDPTAIKIMNALYKNMLSGGNTFVQEPKQTAIARSAIQYTPEVAMGHYQEWLKSQPTIDRTKVQEQINKLRGFITQDRVNDFDELFKALL